ncbi:MAG: YARHG domain-containing protein, partial [Oscillospiraceae bacterium]|nr:YARHG domain-containing protein [Oscillospiraceae bacterium]
PSPTPRRPSSGTTSGGTSAASGSSNTAWSSSSSGGTSSSSTSSVQASGASSNNINAQLTTGGEVIYNSSTGKYLMTFTTGGTMYYANVSAGSTTEQINNKNITISAYPTSESYNGNTIYEITSMTYYDDADYILPQSGTKILTEDDIKGLTKEQLALARNEIYARHGRKFQMAEFRDYFLKQEWYKEDSNYDYDNESSNLNEIEIKNVAFLLAAENKK